jgi:ABC-type phosphate/phosphonate transport system substrate-binding protein
MIPNDPIVVNKKVPPALRDAIQRFFTGLATRAPADFERVVGPLDEQVQGWVRTDARDYDPVRAWVTALERAERGK